MALAIAFTSSRLPTENPRWSVHRAIDRGIEEEQLRRSHGGCPRQLGRQRPHSCDLGIAPYLWDNGTGGEFNRNTLTWRTPGLREALMARVADAG
jgi:hypothetical protein